MRDKKSIKKNLGRDIIGQFSFLPQCLHLYFNSEIGDIHIVCPNCMVNSSVVNGQTSNVASSKSISHAATEILIMQQYFSGNWQTVWYWRAPTLEKLLCAWLPAYYAGDKTEQKRQEGLNLSLVTN